jgi:hypothetical protein
MEDIAPAREDLMAIGLVPDVPYYPVIGCIEYIMESNSEFHHPEACTEMTRIVADHVNYKLPKLLAYLYQIGRLKLSKVFRTRYFQEQVILLVHKSEFTTNHRKYNNYISLLFATYLQGFLIFVPVTG